MVGPHLDQAQRVTRLIEIEIELSGLGLAGNLEVHVGEPAQANGGLVHKAAGLAKVAVLCKLAHLGQLDGVDGGTLPQRLHGAAVRGLDRSRAGKTAAGGNGADRGEIKARRRAPGLGQLERHAADQRGSGLALVLAYGQVAQVDLYQRKVGVDYAHHVGAVGNGHAVHGDIERAGNNVAPLMVGMVAGDFRAAGRVDRQDLCVGRDLAERLLKQLARRSKGGLVVGGWHGLSSL